MRLRIFKTMAAEPILKLIGGMENIGSCHPDLYTFGPGWCMSYHQAHFTVRSTRLNSRLKGYNPTVVPYNLGVPLPTWGDYAGTWYCPLCKKEHDQDRTTWVNPDSGGTEEEPWSTTHRGKALKHRRNCQVAPSRSSTATPDALVGERATGRPVVAHTVDRAQEGSQRR